MFDSQRFAAVSARRHLVAGAAILSGLLLQIAGFTWLSIPEWLVGGCLWLAVMLEWQDLPRRARQQAGILVGLGLGFLLIGRWYYQAPLPWSAIPASNAQVVAMLVGVSFIGLIKSGATPPQQGGRDATGVKGVISTWSSTHLLGSILNLSAVFMVGDHIKARGGLALPQLIALNRGLSSAALWSPFFASMAVAMGLVPEMQYGWILAFGLPLAAFAGGFTAWETNRRFDLASVQGFALSSSSLLMPVAMAALVMLFHYLLIPSLAIISIITFLLPGVALLSNLTDGVTRTASRLGQHVTGRLPNMRGEISLFLSAGLFTLGLSTLIDALAGDQWQLFEQFGAFEAGLSYLTIVVSTVLGLHPIIGISTLAAMLDMTTTNPTLFAYVALTCWGVGSALGPLTGINLSLQGRYGVNGFEMTKRNLWYAAGMSLVILPSFALMAAWL
ncbi:hypothetical protein FGL86_15620 [Pistricoccus aurantiacus]|uniref:Uncharacterized protein n=1 Tax=Pistricoccus aurantiacus TaxID=1883414 RepID=A0A5B8SZY7_9GAMM|nr:hypothetical protein [Pistricoccus aurantiacus]QEA40363.1 hypothetical protein FGL86_15620 [Pistricoccus aurantiacus]